MERNFYKVISSIQRLEDFNPQLRQQLQQYCHDIQGCCQEVHSDMGPFLNEYMYQDALAICFGEHGISDSDCIREYYFTTQFHGHPIPHPHKVDFLVRHKVLVECKAVSQLSTEHRQQLWNYMRLTNVRIGFLYNFAPVKDQCERYYYDPDTQSMYMW